MDLLNCGLGVLILAGWLFGFWQLWRASKWVQEAEALARLVKHKGELLELEYVKLQQLLLENSCLAANRDQLKADLAGVVTERDKLFDAHRTLSEQIEHHQKQLDILKISKRHQVEAAEKANANLVAENVRLKNAAGRAPLLGELLAVIFRDGGQRQAEIRDDREAVSQAAGEVVSLFAERNRLAEEAAGLRRISMVAEQRAESLCEAIRTMSAKLNSGHQDSSN